MDKRLDKDKVILITLKGKYFFTTSVVLRSKLMILSVRPFRAVNLIWIVKFLNENTQIICVPFILVWFVPDLVIIC